jgi:nickel-dependent lactate racemase
MLKIKNEKLEIGDNVLLLDPIGIHTLEVNRSYKIIDMKFNSKGDLTIALEGDSNYYEFDDGSIIHCYYNAKRFTKDIKPIRKKKLQKILESQKEIIIYDETIKRVNPWRYITNITKNRFRLF